MQSQCRRRRAPSEISGGGSESSGTYRRNSQNGGGSSSSAASALALVAANCSIVEYNELVLGCEEEIRLKQSPTKRQNSVLERHQLLRHSIF
jgi:hypothetical protein